MTEKFDANATRVAFIVDGELEVDERNLRANVAARPIVNMDRVEVLVEGMMLLAARVGASRDECLMASEMVREASAHALLLEGRDPGEVERASTEARLHAQTFFRDGVIS